MSAKKLTPANKAACQCWKYNPMTLGGRVHRQCGNKPSWIIKETKPGKDGRKGEMSCCNACRKEWQQRSGNKNVDDSWNWVKIPAPKTKRAA